MATIERSAARVPFEVKASDDTARTFEGLASTWAEDAGGDIIHRGAFARTLDRSLSGKKAIPLIDQHQYGSIRAVLGKMVEAEEREDGLWTKWQIIDGPDGDEAYRRVKAGLIDGLSIGYEAVQYDFEDREERTVRHLREVKLFEVSLVIWPMNDGARVTRVKSLLDPFRDRDLTDADRAQLKEMQEELSALLVEPGLAPDDAKRLELEALARDIQLRSLALC